MDTLISKETVASLLQLGGQYLLPTAALLRALYYGMRGKLPEGIAQILAASAFAGVTAVVGDQQPDLKAIILGILGNSIFTAGLLAFIVTYLLRMPNYGKLADGIVGGFAGLIFWLAWVYVLGNEWEWWLIPLLIVGGGLAFIVLRALLRQIGRLVKIATYLIVAAILLIVAAGGVFLLTPLIQSATTR